MKKKLINVEHGSSSGRSSRRVIKQYFVSQIIKKPMTTKSDLEFLSKKLDLDVKIHWLKDVNRYSKGAQIINLGNPIISGTHWTCTYNGMYFDPFGMPPPPQLSHLQWVSLPIQNMNFGHCGSYVCLFLYYAKMNEIDKFYNLFQIDPNDII